MKNRLKKVTATNDGGWIFVGGIVGAVAGIAGIVAILLGALCLWLLVAM